ncbi:unnamed protein product [Symbiodinium sp. KB8]|nr:unnamed protein product [Symbiodinium sp. KB8]
MEPEPVAVPGEEAAAASLAAVPSAAPTAAAPAATAAVPSTAPAAAAAELEAFAEAILCGVSHGGELWELEQVAGEAAFLLGEQLVKPEDTLLTLGSGTDAVVFRAAASPERLSSEFL